MTIKQLVLSNVWVYVGGLYTEAISTILVKFHCFAQNYKEIFMQDYFGKMLTFGLHCIIIMGFESEVI